MKWGTPRAFYGIDDNEEVPDYVFTMWAAKL